MLSFEVKLYPFCSKV